MRALIVLLAVAAVAVLPAYAHPFTEETSPPRFSNVPVGTGEVVVHYSEALEIQFSKLEVLNSNGERIDNRDTGYYDGDDSLAVTTPPLEEGIYTVTSKVLSRVDGHLVSDAFVFGVGSVALPDTAPSDAELIFLPEAGARFPGLVGQTIVLGSVIASMFIWGHLGIGSTGDAKAMRRRYHGRFMALMGIGLVAVFVSNIMILGVQTWRLEVPAMDALQTGSGTTWMIRMAITVALLGAWFALERMGRLSARNQVPVLAMSLALIATTTMMGHGAASEQPPAVALDYIHNLVSSVWIGGVIFLAFVLLPTFANLGAGPRERWSLAIIPRFSGMVIIALGIVIVSGPLLMYLLESNLGVITASTYGKLIMLKVLIASAMIGIGGYHQITQRRAESDIRFPLHRRLRRTLKVEAGLGVALLMVVALLTNGTLPAGEVQTVEAQQAFAGLSVSEFSENARFDIEIRPFATGTNRIVVEASSLDGTRISDMSSLEVKVSNPGRGIAPIAVPMDAIPGDGVPAYEGEITFGFSGDWQVEVEAQRTQGGNEGVALGLLVKPELENIRAEIVEYEFPEPAAPLYPVYDGAGSIWISDSSGPRIWQYAIQEQEFTEYAFEGSTSIALAVDSSGRIWFTDVTEGRIGFVDPGTGTYEIIELPSIAPRNQPSLPIIIDIAPDDGVWIPVANKNVILRYDQGLDRFETFEMPTEDSGPFAVKVGPDGKVWFTQQTAGQLGYIDPETGRIAEFAPDTPLSVPETITFDADGNLWISEHQTGGGITRFNPILETFVRVQSPDGDALANGAVLDRYRNVWFAQHTVDKLGVYDPHRGSLMEIPLPTEETWVQFTTSDGDGNVWFVEQKPYRLGTIMLTELPGSAVISDGPPVSPLRYAEVAGPLMAAGITAASLFYVKSVRDQRRIDALLEDQ